MPTSFFGRTRSSAAAASVARKQAVPDAVSQLKVNTAAYGAAPGVTGGMRVIMLCRPGTKRPFMTVGLFGNEAGNIAWVCRSIGFLTTGAPTGRTNSTSRGYGGHAMKIAAAECRFGVAATGRS